MVIRHESSSARYRTRCRLKLKLGACFSSLDLRTSRDPQPEQAKISDESMYVLFSSKNRRQPHQ
jgi:hypothetical protein